MLDQIFEKQKAFQQKLGIQTDFITQDIKYRDAITHIVRAQDELNEAMRMLPVAFGGLHKTTSLNRVNLPAFTLEMVDTFLFMVNVMNIMGISPNDFFTSCELKQALNTSRLLNKERFVSTKEYPIIIIDGADGVGKSEICKKLSQRLQIELVTMKRPNMMIDVEIASKTFNQTIDQIKTPLIQDRGWPSSLVYSNYFGRNDDLSYLKELFTDRDVFIFIITANEPFRSDDIIDDDDFLPLQELYVGFANQNGWKIIHNNESSDNCVERIIKELQY